MASTTQDLEWFVRESLAIGESRQISGRFANGKSLPADLVELTREPGVDVSIKDPQTAVAYVYQVTSPTSFKLCAVFGTDSAQTGGNPYGAQDWPHGIGQTCFDRSVEPK